MRKDAEKQPKCVIPATIDCCNPDGVAEAASRHNVTVVFVDNKKPSNLSPEDKADISLRDGVAYSFLVPEQNMAVARSKVEIIVREAMAGEPEKDEE